MTASSESRTAPPPPRTVQVRSWPVHDAGRWALVPVAGLCGAAGAAWMTAGHWLAGLLTASLLAVVSWRYWLPVDFELDATGVTQRVGQRRWRMPWPAMGGYELLSRGARLWPAAPGPLAAAARSIYLPWGSQREVVSAILAEHLGPPAS